MRGLPHRLAGVLLLGAALTGCTGGEADKAAPAAPSEELRIGLAEWSIETGPVQAAAGDVQIVVTNVGATRHDLVVNGLHGSWATPWLDPGEEYVLHVRAAAGEQLELVCSLTGHHSQGMHTQLPVEAAD